MALFNNRLRSFFYPGFWLVALGASGNLVGDDKQDLKERVGVLILQLGDPNYTKRQSAKDELERIGVIALDQLHVASFHPDPQIATQARFIVRSNQFNWAWEFDSPKVREILNNYSAADVIEKSTYIDELANLERDDGLAALCRLARYETRGVFSKQAALHVLRSKPLAGQSPENRARRVISYLDGGESVASNWIRQYFQNQTDFQLGWWESQIETERKSVGNSNLESSPSIVSGLTRWTVQQLASKEASYSKAIELGGTLFEDRPPTLNPLSQSGSQSSQAEELAQWALQWKLPELVQLQHQKLPFKIVSREPLFTYLLAESYQQQGKIAVAEEIAAKAFENIPTNSLGEKIDPASDKDALANQLESTLGYRNLSSNQRRMVLGNKLAESGRFQWAIRELKVAASSEMTNPSTLFALRSLASVYHGLGQFGDARATLEPFCLRYDSEPMFRSQQVVENADEMREIRSKYYQYAGDAALEKLQSTDAVGFYSKSLDVDPENVDALIGLYKLQGDERFVTDRKDRWKDIYKALKNKIEKYEEYRKKVNGSELATFTEQTAHYQNICAWLICNTEGDSEEALTMSRKACSLVRDRAEYLDTLAHCYYAAGKWKEAVEQQRRAVEMKPFQPELQRALARFEEKRKQVENR